MRQRALLQCNHMPVKGNRWLSSAGVIDGGLRPQYHSDNIKTSRNASFSLIFLFVTTFVLPDLLSHHPL